MRSVESIIEVYEWFVAATAHEILIGLIFVGVLWFIALKKNWRQFSDFLPWMFVVLLATYVLKSLLPLLR